MRKCLKQTGDGPPQDPNSRQEEGTVRKQFTTGIHTMSMAAGQRSPHTDSTSAAVIL